LGFGFGFIKAWALLEREIPSWVLALDSSKLDLCLRGRCNLGLLWIPSNVELYFVWGLPKINKKTHAAFVWGTSPEKGGREKKKKPNFFFSEFL